MMNTVLLLRCLELIGDSAHVTNSSTITHLKFMFNYSEKKIKWLREALKKPVNFQDIVMKGGWVPVLQQD